VYSGRGAGGLRASRVSVLGFPNTRYVTLEPPFKQLFKRIENTSILQLGLTDLTLVVI